MNTVAKVLNLITAAFRAVNLCEHIFISHYNKYGIRRILANNYKISGLPHYPRVPYVPVFLLFT